MEEKDIKQQLLDLHKDAAIYYYVCLQKKEGKKGRDYFYDKRELDEETIKDFGLGFSTGSGQALYEYFKDRGYDDEVLNQSGIISRKEDGTWSNKYWNRVMYPIANLQGDIVGFGGRVLDDSKPKYLNSPETLIFDKSNNLYALNKAVLSDRPYFILCEGYMDVIALHKSGFDCAVASLGTAYTQNHAAIIKNYTDHVYLSFDSDGPGINAALRAIPICKAAGLECKIINMKPYKDPDEFMKGLGVEEYEKRIEQAETAYAFLTRIAKQNALTEEGTLEDKIAFYTQIANLAMEVKDDNRLDEEIESFKNR